MEWITEILAGKFRVSLPKRAPGEFVEASPGFFNGGMPRVRAPGMHSPGYLLGSAALSEPSPDE